MQKNFPAGNTTLSQTGALDAKDITTAEVTRRLSAKLRSLIGPGRAWSYRGVAHLTGIDERSLHAYTRGETCPNLAKYKRLLSVLGPVLSVELDQMYGWQPRASSSAPGSVDLQEIASELRERLRLIDLAIDAARRR